MSFCRWGSKSDLYCYEAKEGFIVHVGMGGLPIDGKTFIEPTLSCLLSRLLKLREIGYKVPDYAIAEVEADIEAEAVKGNI